MQSRADFYQKLLSSGVVSINEVREKEGMNPTDGGDAHSIQVNTIALSSLQAYSDKIAEPDKNGE